MVLLTAKYLQTLKSRVVDSGESKNWLGKDILEIGSEIYGLINNGVNNFPVVSTLTGLTEPILEPIKQIAEQLIALPDISILAGLVTLESIYGINKAYNTKLYKGQNLVAYANNIMSRDIPSSDDEYYYVMGISAYNETLNIPLLNSEITNLQSKFGGIQSQAQSTINQFADKFGLDYLQDKITELEGLIASAGESASNTIKNQLYRLKNFVKKFMGISSSPQSIPTLRQSSGQVASYGTFGAIELIIPTDKPKLTDVVGVINKLANWFLSMFSIPNQILEVLTHTVTSVVCKAIGSAGAEVSRYLSAGLLQSLPQLVPKIGSATGTLFGGAWAVLMGYAPWIALVAGLILVAFKLSDKKVKFGRLVYLFGTRLSGSPDTGFAGTYDMNEKQMRDYIIDFSKRMLNEAKSTYVKFWAFNVNDDEEVALMFDLTNINEPIEISDKTIQTTTWDSLKHFAEEPF
ncbi:ProB (plasmid) [Planktothrix rubescens CCAP 1459/22]|uniref:ProB n=3 Tax=Planktothrix TaxID=54304 RepID=A0A6J7ZEY7_PLARU|nr:hypothetical protein [Planktothrix rubescens]CAC5339682.1 ProB [Planktothrix rubescens NIVA-CYA 18]CAD5986022.1 ProB [Planktothrix rubescens NIVA-CYA 18]